MIGIFPLNVNCEINNCLKKKKKQREFLPFSLFSKSSQMNNLQELIMKDKIEIDKSLIRYKRTLCEH